METSIALRLENGILCASIGDTLGLTPIIEVISRKNGELVNVDTVRPELFFNNPYVNKISNNRISTINILPCRCVACNIVHYYGEQIGVDFPNEITPKIYLDDNEIMYGKNQMSNFDGSMKIAVSLETGFNSKNLRHDYIKPLLDKLRDDGHKLIGVGKGSDKQYDYDISYVNNSTLREVFSIIGSCDLFLGIDSGLFHSAAALNIPQVIFFRNNQSANNKYYNTHYIDSRVKCVGECLNHKPVCRALVRCMDSFNLDEYYELIGKVLDD